MFNKKWLQQKKTKNSYNYNTTYINEPPDWTLFFTWPNASPDYRRLDDQYRRQEYWTRWSMLLSPYLYSPTVNIFVSIFSIILTFKNTIKHFKIFTQHSHLLQIWEWLKKTFSKDINYWRSINTNAYIKIKNFHVFFLFYEIDLHQLMCLDRTNPWIEG